MSRTYKKRPIYSHEDLKFGTGSKFKNGEWEQTGTQIPAKHKVNHFEVKVAEARVLGSSGHNSIKFPRFIPDIKEEQSE